MNRGGSVFLSSCYSVCPAQTLQVLTKRMRRIQKGRERWPRLLAALTYTFFIVCDSNRNVRTVAVCVMTVSFKGQGFYELCRFEVRQRHGKTKYNFQWSPKNRTTQTTSEQIKNRRTAWQVLKLWTVIYVVEICIDIGSAVQMHQASPWLNNSSQSCYTTITLQLLVTECVPAVL